MSYLTYLIVGLSCRYKKIHNDNMHRIILFWQHPYSTFLIGVIFLVSRQYFYVDENGATQKYVYCLRCGGGPFRKDEIDKKFRDTGSERYIHYCIPCTKIIGLKDSVPKISEHLTGYSTASPPYISASIKPVIPTIIAEIPRPVKIPEVAPEISIDIPEPIKIPKEKLSIEENKPLATRRTKLKAEKNAPINEIYAVYIAQCSDNSYVCGVSTDLTKEARSLNSGALFASRLPVEIVYYQTVVKKEDAARARSVLTKCKRSRKEQLIAKFEKQFFSD